MRARVMTIEQKAKGKSDRQNRRVILLSYSRSVLSPIFAFCLLPFAICLVFLLSASAQQASRTMGPDFLDGVPGTYAIRNARIVTVTGAEIENGTVVVRDGRIESVGANATVPAGAQEIDARGLSVYPGMLDLGTSMGLVEIPHGASAIACGVEPSRLMNAACPEMIPPCGDDNTLVTPLTRVTATCALCGLMPK